MLKLLKDPWIILTSAFLISLSTLALQSVESSVFPIQYIYIFVSIILFLIFSNISFDIFFSFSWHLYIISIVLLLLTLLIGKITRGAVRWIPIGSFTIQPTEIIRPFLILFFAKFLTQHRLNTKDLFKSLILLAIPVSLILLQPSLGVAVMTTIGFLGVLLAADFNKKLLGIVITVGILLAPFSYFLMAPYQQIRIQSLFSPEADPAGAGYNSIQSKIAVGSGKLTGRGLGEGVQTQLAFLPEKHTDFIFASIAEEMGFVGASLILLGLFFLGLRISSIVANATDIAARAFVSGIFLVFLTQTIIHIGMNMGLLPITGLPLPLVSAGGSSLLATSIMLGMVVASKQKK